MGTGVSKTLHYAYPQPQPHPQISAYHRNKLQFQHAACTSKVHVTAGDSQYVICAKYEIHMKFNQQLQPSMCSRGYSSGTRRVVTCRLIIISCPVPPRLVHGMLWHWLDLWREWLCISYFYIQISKCLWCGFEDRDILCIVCVGGSPCSNYSIGANPKYEGHIEPNSRISW